jgi:hypothetical protein
MSRSAVFCLGAIVLASVAMADEPAKHTGYEFTVGESKVKLYGFTRLDVEYTDSRSNDPQVIQWIRSENDSVPSGGNYAQPDDPEMSIHPKLTRMGLDLGTPPVAKLGNAKASAKIEVDFYNAAASESRAALRMRHAYFKLAWTRAALTVGQLTDLISPLMPVVNNDLVMWNAGNLGDRRPQIRFELLPAVGDGNRLALQAMLGQTGVIDGQSLDGGTGPAANDGVDAAVPTVQGRLGWTGKHVWVPATTYEVGVWGHTATEALPEGGMIAGEDEWTSSAFGFDLRLPVHAKVSIEAEGWAGKNLDDVRGGIGQGVNNASYASGTKTVSDVNRGKEIESSGGWAQLTVQAAPVYAVSVGGSFDDPEDNLQTGKGARDKNTVIYLANRIMPGGGFTFGLDYLNWKTEWTGGDRDGEANRLNLFGQYSF